MALSYNGIDFGSHLRTRHHVYGPAKDPSGSDQLYTILQLSVDAQLNPAYLPAIGGETPTQTCARIRHMLTQPRGALYYDLTSLPGVQGAAPIINLPDGRDDANGPWPDAQACTVNYTTQGTFEITWSVVVCFRDCGSLTPEEPLSLRWEDSIAFDNTWKATYSRVGTLIISSRQANNIDWFRRNKLAPTIPAGFHRVNSRYSCSRDGLRCDFLLVDEQIRFAPPYPGVELEILQSESAPTLAGMKRGAVAVRMVGVQNGNIVDLAHWALWIMKCRVMAADSQFRGKVLGTFQLETRETTRGFEVNASASYKVQPDGTRNTVVSGNGGLNFWKTAFPALNLVPNVKPTVAPGPAGRSPLGTSTFPWVGFGTSPTTAQNPQGYAEWANNTAAVGGPPDGVGLAAAVSLFSALLNDPCGTQMSTTPYGDSFTVELRTSPGLFDTPAYGQGGTSQVQTQQLSASLSTLNASQYPATLVASDVLGLSAWDGLPAVYDHWQCLNEYIDDPGTDVMPCGDPDGLNVAVNYSSAQITLVRRWTARRDGSPPAVPPKISADANFIYVGGVAPQLRELRASGDGVSVIYEVSGIYKYKALNAAAVPFIAEIPPFMPADQLANAQQWFTNELRGGA